MEETLINRIRQAETDDEELNAVAAALSAGQVTVHQLTQALGIADSELGDFLISRAQVISVPASLQPGDIIVSTQRAASTVIRVERAYRRRAGESSYSAEVTMPGNRRQKVDAETIDQWFPVKVVRAQQDQGPED